MNNTPLISIYKDIWDKTSKYTISIEDALNRIKTGKSRSKVIEIRNEANEERQNYLKEKLPSVTFSGTFSERYDDKLIKHSGFICLDFDNVDPLTYKQMLSGSKYAYAVWVSPRRNGVKMLVKIADGKKHREHFAALQKQFPDIDNKCKNESRVCYESYDPDIYINTESEVYSDIIKQNIPEPPKVKLNLDNDYYEIYQKLLSWLERRGNVFSKGNRNYFIYVLSGAMCRFGVSEGDTLMVLQQEYCSDKDFTHKEVEKAVRSAYKANRHSHGSVSFENEELKIIETHVEVDPQIFEDGYTPDDVVYGIDVFEDAIDVYKNGYKKAETTYIPKLDAYFKWKKGELTVLSGIGNYGKSSYMSQLQLIKSLNDGTKWAVFSPESAPASEYYFELAEMLVGCPCDGGYRNRPPQQIFENAYQFVSEHFFFIYSDKLAPSPEFIKKKFMELIIKEKCEGVIIDPFNQLANDYKGGRDDKYLEVFLADFLRFARQNNVYFVIVTHPHKMSKEGMKDYPCPNVFDLAGGAMWNNKSDNILVYHRPFAQSDPENPACEHHSKKIRKQKMIGKTGFFDFELNRLKRRFYFDNFSPLDGNRFEYGYIAPQMKITPNLQADDNTPLDEAPF